jgi:DNA polymerase-3 subunit epsilon
MTADTLPVDQIKMLSSMIKAMTPKKKEVYGNIVSVRQALEKFDNKVCLLDTETTGLGRDDRIVEISIIPFDLSTMQMGKSSSTFIDPKKRIPEEASKIHNIYDKDVAGKPTFDQIMPRLFPYLSSRLVVIHNSKFDMRMILNEAKRAKVRLPSIYTLCTYNLSRHLFPGAIVKLQELHSRLIGEHEQTHSALDDSLMLGRLFAYYMSNFKDTVMDFNVEPSWVLNPPPKAQKNFPKTVGI